MAGGQGAGLRVPFLIVPCISIAELEEDEEEEGASTAFRALGPDVRSICPALEIAFRTAVLFGKLGLISSGIAAAAASTDRCRSKLLITERGGSGGAEIGDMRFVGDERDVGSGE